MYYYKDNTLMCEDLDLKSLTSKYKAPFYVYSKKTIKDNIKKIKDVFLSVDNVFIAYAMKAENNISILKIMIDEGLGADVVSVGEIEKYIKAGGDTKKIVFSGVAKSHEEIKRAIELNIKQFNIESIDEALRINNIAKSMNKNVSCAIRVNPNVDALTHHKITTGTKGDKFGISIKTIEDNAELLKSMSNIKINTLAMHIGSQMLNASPFYEAVKVLKKLYEEVSNIGLKIDTLDIGGGFGVGYNKGEASFDFDSFKKNTVELLRDTKLNIMLEPGRFLIAKSGALIMKVEYIKHEWGKTYVILNGGMNDYIRVAMYDAHNEILPLSIKEGSMTSDFVGPICESSDIFAGGRVSSNLEEGDYVALLDSGAYGASMASNYNMKPLRAQVLVDKTNSALIRKEQSIEQMIENDILI